VEISEVDEEMTIFIRTGGAPNNGISNGLQEYPIKIQKQCSSVLLWLAYEGWQQKLQ